MHVLDLSIGCIFLYFITNRYCYKTVRDAAFNQIHLAINEPKMSLSADNDLTERPIDCRKKEFNENHDASPASISQDDVNTGRTSSDWGNLPHVVLVNIFENLEEATLLLAQYTCKRWYDVIHHSASLWREKSFRFSGVDPRGLTHAPYKFATQFTKTFGKYLQTLEFNLFNPVSSSVCKKFQKCLKVCLNNLVKNKAKVVELSIPHLQLDRWQWMLYREDFCSILAAFFRRGQHTIEIMRLEGARAYFDDGYKVLYAMGYNTGATIVDLNIEDMFSSRQPIFEIPQFVGCFKNFPRLESLIMNYSYLSEDLLETLANALQYSSLMQLLLKVVQHEPHDQVIWGHSWRALTKQCPDLRVEVLFQRVLTFDDHFRILLQQIPLSGVSFVGS